ncbi:hypothetical protein C922_05085 [Plasmodium inui San Antonio 1]|uniref:Uncharacterized protein n=1 Tax=Plasmodium inui San Antonio 1 TaxID=1237626 RepID=W6ZYZ0_9APIC|nr:hypothetical protein C922_05085 [Plasmodium inui San Antonio 1]EUD64523.1 hypothetical protein C922_05085 [Plasmodium inui San Antonio 1]
MASFSRYMKHIEEGIGRAWCKTNQDNPTGTICGLSPNGQTQDVDGLGNRWIGILGTDAVMLSNIGQAAKIICNSIDTWAANLESQEREGQWNESRCISGELGIQGRPSIHSTCNWKADQAVWYLSRTVRTLNPKNPEQRSLMVCMDIVSIILGIFGNAQKTDDEYKYKNKNLCQSVYEAFCKWGGQQIANDLMDFWFPDNTTGIKIGGKTLPSTTGQGGTWRDALYIRPKGITSIQCSSDKSQGTRTYTTSCYWTKETSGCQNYSDNEWTAAEEWKRESKQVSETSLKEYFIQVEAGTLGGSESDMSSNKTESQRVLGRFMISGKNQPQRCKKTVLFLRYARERLNPKLSRNRKRKQRR